jgi:hypothetical protein
VADGRPRPTGTRDCRRRGPEHSRPRPCNAHRRGRAPTSIPAFAAAPAEPFGWIDFPPSINRLVGLRRLGRIPYPDAFPEDPRPVVRDFHLRLYHRTPSESELDALIATAERVPPA